LLVVVKSARLTDNGDNDGFADPHETVNVFLTLRNVSDLPLTGIGVALVTDDPRVACVLTSVVAFGSLAAKETREATVPLSFRVAGVARATPDEELTAVFDVLIWGDGFDASLRPCGWPPGHCRQPPQQITFDLDLDVSGGLLPTSFTEGFESGGFGTFTTMTLDVGKASNALSDGHRCQYHDPDFANSYSYGRTFCYLGFTAPADNAYDWHVHGLASPDGGRAYLGNNSLHWGVHPGAPSVDTTRLAQLDAIRSLLPVNLGWNGVVPELSFKHQVGLVDADYDGNIGTTLDRGVVQVQLANSAGQAIGNWRNIRPYQNVYDSQAIDNYVQCFFDPTDDGNDEDDYFDPTDPSRRYGPSSTCFPEFAFSRLGAIFYTATFDPADIAHASDGPGLQGSRGPGTWVESKFSLDRYRGRRVRIRFLATSIEVYPGVTQEQALNWNPSPAEDGWYIDDIRVSNTLTSAATVRVDTSDRSALPGCPAGCASLSASLVADPNPSSMPGQPIVLDASGSAADTCPGGPLLYRFWHDRNGDGVLAEPLDRLLRSWTDNPILQEAPHYTRAYAVEAQCSSQRTCADRADIVVTVPCAPPLFNTLRFTLSKWYLTWDVPAPVDVLRGDLDALRANGGNFQGTVIACSRPCCGMIAYAGDDEPPLGSGFYYLAREAGPTYACGPSWGTGSPAELPGAGGDRDADLALDPNQCP
jgi:hypothetical protein